ncbi:RNase H family protein, partial [Roseomonas gilardii]
VIEWRWVRGHSGDPMNERADVLATEARKALSQHGCKNPLHNG